jgi:transposase-like protein
MAIRRTEEEWAAIMTAYEASGNSIAAWCRENGMSTKTFYSHIKKMRMSKSAATHRTHEEWSALIKEQRNSGLSRAAWCREHGINQKSMESAERSIHTTHQNKPGHEWVRIMAKEDTDKALIKPGSVKIRYGAMEVEIDGSYPMERLGLLIERIADRC